MKTEFNENGIVKALTILHERYVSVTNSIIVNLLVLTCCKSFFYRKNEKKIMKIN